MSWGDLMIFTCVVTTCFSKIGQNISWTQYWECYLWQWGDGQGLSIHCSGATVSTEKRRNTEENGKSHYLQTVQWQNHLQVILWLICHVEVRHSVFCIVRKCQSCASTWGERRNAFMSDSELQTTLSGWLTFLPLFLKRSHLLFPCLVHQSPHLFIVLPWLCLWPQSMSCHHSGLWASAMT